jgi:hypothetical protein
MANISIRSIYQQSNILEDRLPLVPFMRDKERSLFVKEVQALIDAAKRTGEAVSSPRTKSRLQNLIETWEELLIDIASIPVQMPPLISEAAKTSPSLIKAGVKTSPSSEFTHSFSAPPFASEIMSSRKLAPNSYVTIPHDPEVRAFLDKLFGIVDAEG